MHILRRRSELLEADSLNKAPEFWVCLDYWALEYHALIVFS